MNTIKLPTAEIIQTRLAELFPADDDYMRERWWPKLVRLAERELYPQGVNLSVELALYDFLVGFPTAMAAVMRLRMDVYLQALLPNAADHEAVMAVRRQVEEIAGQGNA